MTPGEQASELQKVIDEERALKHQAIADREALISEFNEANTPDEVRDTIIKKAREAGVAAILRINHLIDHAEKEATQLSAAKYIADLIIQGALDSKGSGIQDLIDKLAANDNVEQTS